jgi:predicted PurR-regulated permease PerM
VPPLAVVGVCLGHGDITLALGALVLFLSNLLALVLAGVLTFTALGYTTEALAHRARPRRQQYVVLGALIVLVVVPLAANTALSYLVGYWTTRVDDAATTWLKDSPDASVTSVDFESTTVHVHVRYEGALPPVSGLLDQVSQVLPDGMHVVLDTSVGNEIDVGTVGSAGAG